MNDDVISGLAEQVDERRQQLELGVGDLATAAGLTRQGLDPVRAGHRRNYNDKTRFGVARALRWPPDWLERIDSGEDLTEWPTDQPTEAPPWERILESNQQITEALRSLEALIEQRLPDEQ